MNTYLPYGRTVTTEQASIDDKFIKQMQTLQPFQIDLGHKYYYYNTFVIVYSHNFVSIRT